MFCENDECCSCHKEVPVIAFGASDISEGYRLKKCQGRQKIVLSEGGKNDFFSLENLELL